LDYKSASNTVGLHFKPISHVLHAIKIIFQTIYGEVRFYVLTLPQCLTLSVQEFAKLK